ncbi:MAG: hypothetical protein LUD72_11315 [Bacteroidales bacterium]|nr:hypothetical protein [Bacteroidales bacterium]
MANKSQRKGRNAEITLARLLRDAGYLGVRPGRALSYGAEPDLTGLPFIHPEVKFVERLNVQEAMDQAIRDSEKFEDGLPAVFHKRSRCPWLVTMTLDDWLKLYEYFVAGKSKE